MIFRLIEIVQYTSRYDFGFAVNRRRQLYYSGLLNLQVATRNGGFTKTKRKNVARFKRTAS